MSITNIIFDLDGTLIDSSDGVVDAVNYSLRQMGEAEQSPEIIKTFIGYPLSQMYPSFSSAPVKELYRHFQDRARATIVASTVALPGADEVLRQLANEGYRLAVATTKIKRHVDGIMAKLGWGGLLSSAIGGDEVSRVKPDPEIINLSMERLGGSRDDSIVVGDTVNDVLAASAAGLRVVAVDSPYGGREKLMAAGPDYMIDSISELIDLLGKIKKEAS